MRCAVELGNEISGECGFEIRAGLHTAEIELRGDDIGGITVHEAARVLGTADGGEVVASQTPRSLVNGGDVALEHCGTKALKGIPGKAQLFRVAETAPN